MFNGPYFITQVDHAITAGNFQTTFSGVRQGIYDLPSIDNFLQSINQNLLTKIEAIVKNSKDSVTGKAITNVDKSKYVTQTGDSTAAAQNSCRNNLAEAYNTWGDAQTSNTMGLTPKEFITELEKKTNDTNLQVIIYMICYAKTFPQGGTKFYGYNNNYANVTLTTDYGASGGFFSPKKYSCVNISNITGKPTSQPIANFDTIGKFFDFMISKLSANVNRIINETTGLGINKYYVCYWPVSGVTEAYYDSHVSEFKTLQDTFDKAFKSAGDFGLNVESTTQLKIANANQKKKIAKTYAGVVTPPNNLNTTTNVVPSCPPPTITSFSPLTGASGTILTIVGKNLDEVTGMTINNVLTTTGITINSSFNIAVVVPYSNISIPQNNTIVARGPYGSSASLTTFTYNPLQKSAAPPTTIPGAPPNVNSQPQQTGPIVLTGKTTSNLIGSNEDLTVGVNPAAGNWEILSEFNNWQYKVVKRVLGPNNVVVEEILDEGNIEQEFRRNVSTNKQKFFLSDFNLIAGLKANTTLTDKEIASASVIYNKFEFVASSPDKFVKWRTTGNPDDVIDDVYQSFTMLLKFR